MPNTALKPALALTLCLYGALALGAYQLLHSPKPQITDLSLGNATIDLDLGQFVAAPSPEPAQEPAQEEMPPPEPETQHEPVPAPQLQTAKPQVKPEPKVQARPEPVTAKKRKAHHKSRRHEVAKTQAKRGGGGPSGASQRVLILGKDQHPVLLGIKKAIDGNLLYPRKARVMRLEGVAVVQFTYTKERKLRSLRLIKGTGHQLLDEAALSAIKRALSSFPQVSENYTLRLPIRFELT